jgi:hypothetical protein
LLLKNASTSTAFSSVTNPDVATSTTLPSRKLPWYIAFLQPCPFLLHKLPDHVSGPRTGLSG